MVFVVVVVGCGRCIGGGRRGRRVRGGCGR